MSYPDEGGRFDSRSEPITLKTPDGEEVTFSTGRAIALDDAAEDFLASTTGTSVLLEGSDITILIPVGPVGASLAFGDGSDTRELLLTLPSTDITIGAQTIEMDPIRLMAAV